MPARARLKDGTRASVYFEQSAYEMLDRIALQQQVSIAAVVRWAVDDYLTQRFGRTAPEPERAAVAV